MKNLPGEIVERLPYLKKPKSKAQIPNSKLIWIFIRIERDLNVYVLDVSYS